MKITSNDNGDISDSIVIRRRYIGSKFDSNECWCMMGVDVSAVDDESIAECEAYGDSISMHEEEERLTVSPSIDVGKHEPTTPNNNAGRNISIASFMPESNFSKFVLHIVSSYELKQSIIFLMHLIGFRMIGTHNLVLDMIVLGRNIMMGYWMDDSYGG